MLNSLKPIYLISSDVTLLQQEARDKLRSAAKKNGFSAFEKHHVESGFHWEQFFSTLQNYSLFSDKAFVELSFPTAKFDAKAIEALTHYLKNPSPDKLLLILTNKLTSAQLKTRWYKALETCGTCQQIRAISRQELPEWIKQRAKSYKLSLLPESITLLTELTEGNLNATQQALYKLKLLYPTQQISPNYVIEVISNNARFNVFDLANACLSGQTRAALRYLQGLNKTGVEPTLVLWGLCREIRACLKINFHRERGTSLQMLLQKEWQSRRPLLKQALTRLSSVSLKSLLLLAEETDLIIKGQKPGSSWDHLERLITLFCEQPTTTRKRLTC